MDGAPVAWIAWHRANSEVREAAGLLRVTVRLAWAAGLDCGGSARKGWRRAGRREESHVPVAGQPGRREPCSLLSQYICPGHHRCQCCRLYWSMPTSLNSQEPATLPKSRIAIPRRYANL